MSSPADKEHKEAMNHQAYLDVLECADPRYEDDLDYMRAYQFWLSVCPANHPLVDDIH